MAAVSPKTPQTGEHSGGDSGWAQPQETGEVQEYCLGSPGEQFLPILFEDSGGAAECVPPEELITFEEDALREVASHIEAKLAHALSCMVLAAAARTKAAAAHAQSQRAGKGSSSAPAASPTLPGTTPVDPSVEEEPEGPGGSPTAISAGRRSGPKRRRPSLTAARRGSRSSSPLRVGRSSSPAHKPRTAVSAAAPGAPGSPTTSAAVRCPKVEDPSAAARAEEAPKAPEAPDNDGVLIELEDLFATYGPSPSLLRHPNCFQKTPDLLRQQLY